MMTTVAITVERHDPPHAPIFGVHLRGRKGDMLMRQNRSASDIVDFASKLAMTLEAEVVYEDGARTAIEYRRAFETNLRGRTGRP